MMNPMAISAQSYHILVGLMAEVLVRTMVEFACVPRTQTAPGISFEITDPELLPMGTAQVFQRVRFLRYYEGHDAHLIARIAKNENVAVSLVSQSLTRSQAMPYLDRNILSLAVLAPCPTSANDGIAECPEMGRPTVCQVSVRLGRSGRLHAIHASSLHHIMHVVKTRWDIPSMSTRQRLQPQVLCARPEQRPQSLQPLAHLLFPVEFDLLPPTPTHGPSNSDLR